ncbi:MAG: glycoside hydrolase family 3 protein [Prevotella sp.]
MMKKIRKDLFVAILLMVMVPFSLISCSDDESAGNDIESSVEEELSKMTLREKVGQMFFVRPESLDTTIHWTSTTELPQYKTQAVNIVMNDVNKDYPVGGIILFAHNIDNETQLSDYVSQIRKLYGSPLLCIDEEGGRVARIANNPNFNVPKYESMAAIGDTGDPANAYNASNTIGKYLKAYGFDIDFAPVADVNTNPDNIVIGARAFSSDPQIAAPMVVNYLQGLRDAGITGCLKHFPGHGDTHADSHLGFAETRKTWEEMLECEMITFKAGIAAGAQLVMTAHIAAPEVTGTNLPSTLSEVMLQDKLRGELGYKNIIITDAMEMGAITQLMSSGEAAVKTIEAGADIVLCPQNFCLAFDCVVEAVESGKISRQRIDNSVRRILTLKRLRL